MATLDPISVCELQMARGSGEQRCVFAAGSFGGCYDYDCYVFYQQLTNANILMYILCNSEIFALWICILLPQQGCKLHPTTNPMGLCWAHLELVVVCWGLGPNEFGDCRDGKISDPQEKSDGALNGKITHRGLVKIFMGENASKERENRKKPLNDAPIQKPCLCILRSYVVH